MSKPAKKISFVSVRAINSARLAAASLQICTRSLLALFTLLKCLMVLMGVAGFNSICGQAKWDGEAGDSAWLNPLNWMGDLIPITGQTVVLDNSVIPSSYTVIFPSADFNASLESLTIQPSDGNVIELRIPKTNIAAPALTLTGLSQSIKISAGGVVINSSGASSGSTIEISDSIVIMNGGRYIHQTARPHASLVDRLSRIPGSEFGIFEFDIPSASSTISLSDRTYGSLVLNSAAANGFVNYTAAGTRKIIIRGNLVLNSGVRLNLNCSDTLHINSDLIVDGTLNLSTNLRNLAAAVHGNVQLNPAGIITESGSSEASLIMAGNGNRNISLGGILTNQVRLVMAAKGNIYANRSMSLPFDLELVSGILRMPGDSILILLPGCTVSTDVNNINTFVDGAVKKVGLLNHDFVFPVGTGMLSHWINLKNSEGDVTVTYKKQNPKVLSNEVVGIHHTSSLEYWVVNTTQSNNGTASIELSFPDGNHSGVTDMASLQVAMLSGGKWVDAGNAATTGSAGGKGSVTSNPISEFTPGVDEYFTLATNSISQNPLPLKLILHHSINSDRLRFKWSCFNWGTQGKMMLLQSRAPGGTFTTITQITYDSGKWNYEYELQMPTIQTQYRLAVEDEMITRYSNVISINNQETNELSVQQVLPVRSNLVDLIIETKSTKHIQLSLYGASGELLSAKYLLLMKGKNRVSIPAEGFTKGLYILVVTEKSGRKTVSKILK